MNHNSPAKIWNFECTVPPEYHQIRVDSVLAKMFPEHSRNQWIEWLRAENICSQGKLLNPKTKVQAQQLIHGQVMLNIPQVQHQPENIPLNIVYEDHDLIILNKPAGLVVHPGAGQANHTLMNALLYYQPQLNTLARAGMIHRLDKDTSGLMIIAKTSMAYLKLIDMMQARQIQRQYFALVHGMVRNQGSIRTAFGRHPQQRLKMAVRPQGKLAITHYAIAEKFSQNTLLNVTLETGRTHQIRVHLQHIHHPIVGDKLYGKPKAGGSAPIATVLDAFPRQALHAHCLNFIHPITEKALTFTAILPDDFSSLLQKI